MIEDKEKLLVYIAVAFVSMVILVIIVSIWLPNSSVKSTLNQYEEMNYTDSRIEYYKNNILGVLTPANYEKIYKKIDSTFAEENNISDAEQLKNYLINNQFISSAITLNDVTLLSKGDEYLFRVSYTISGRNRYLIIREPEVNEYSFYFSDNGLLKNVFKEKVEHFEDLEFVINVKESTTDTITFNVKINNNSQDERVDFNFSNLYSVQLLLEDSSMINMSTVALTGDEEYHLNPNSSVTVDLVYQLPQEQQGKIKSLYFKDVHFKLGYVGIYIDY